MQQIKVPKIFISYSWSSPEHEEWVLELAESLMADGVDIALDKWALREGDDPIIFMESMVNDPTITKIIMIIDGKYTDRANQRHGGVGTESTILSQELYSKRDKNKIVAVIAEPDAPKPTFYAGRLHVDLSNDERYAEEYEKLVRWAYDKYKYEKPKILGSAPSFIVAEDDQVALFTNTQYKMAIDALEKGKNNASSLVRQYLDKLHSELPKFSVSVEDKNIEATFIQKLEHFKPHLQEFKMIVNTVCTHSSDSKIFKHFRSFLENLLNLLILPPNQPGRLTADLELFSFINYQIFLSLVTILIKNEEFDELKEILEELYMLPEDFHDRYILQKKYKNFSIFNPQNYDFIEKNIRPRFYSPLGELVKDFSDNSIITFEEICEADAFLYIKTLANGMQDNEFYLKRWWPHVSFYISRHRTQALKVFVKSERSTYFDDIKKVLNVTNLQFIEDALKNQGDLYGSNPFIPTWHGSFVKFDMKTLTNLEKLHKL
ncbi:toll/interleukin-1 receptor domain-containing protein [Acinetobacter sp. NyZ410]|uniref:toll/interleukin-1 receptor domain-containing protein n=1 Tax=Acinetobacter sp. NyZ410 TaxID=2929509 RepID=UPI001FBBC806|nr:toll/interleukin-1 receptor domain-containing protein [Acinetobacter sp. NyZ410]UOH16899.1 toll/interleukin-1 receptor domain-containing protein [Acinetobacter sp. NyZ410]